MIAIRVLVVLALALYSAVAQTNSFIIQAGDTVGNGTPGPGAGNIEATGAVDLYTFTNAPGDRLFFDSLGTSGNIYWQVSDGSGFQLFNWHFNSGDPGQWTLPNAGTNTIRVYGNSGGTGTYGFKIWTVPPSQQFVTAIDQPVSDGIPSTGAGNIESPGAVDNYTFTNGANQRLFFDSLGTSANIHWRVLDSAGHELFDWHFNSGDPGIWTLPAAGTNSIQVYGVGDARGTYGFRIWPVPVAQEFTISVDQPVSNGTPAPGAGNIESPGAVDIFVFTNTPGQKLFFDSAGTSSSIYWQVLDAIGNELFNWHFNSGDPGEFTLPAGGQNTIRVYGQNDARGTYGFRIWNVLAPTAFTTTIGNSVSNGFPASGAGNIETAGGSDVYTFTNGPGQRVFFDSAGSSANIFWQVLDRNGNELFNWNFNWGDPGTWTLASAGTNTIRVYGQGDDRGTYTFKLWNVPMDQFFSTSVGSVVSNGAPALGAGNIESPGAMDIYTFTNTPGQRVFFDTLGASATGTLMWEVTDAIGNELFDLNLNGSEPGAWALAIAGTNTIRVRGNGDARGTYGFRLWNVAAVERFAISIGSTVNNGSPALGAGNIETVGGMDLYTFTNAPGDRVFFDSLGASASIFWQALDANGNQLFNQNLNGGDPGTWFLPFAGTNTIRVIGSGTSTGTYSFALVSSTNLVANTNNTPVDRFSITLGLIVTNGIPSAGAGNLEAPGARDQYTFTVAPGQNVFFEDLGGSNYRNLRYDVYDETGAQLFGEWLGNDQEVGRRTLTRGGTYTLIVTGAGNTATGTYGLKIWSVPADPIFNIAIGDLVTNDFPLAGAGNIEIPGAQDVYTFAASAGQTVFFEDRGAASHRNVRFDVYDDSGTFLFGEWLGNDQEVGRRTLTRGGTYRVVVSGYWNTVSTYSFKIWNVPVSLDIPIALNTTITNNVPVAGAGNIETPGAQDSYTFQAPPGQSLFFEDLGASNFRNIRMDVYDDTGAFLFGEYIGGDQELGHRLLSRGGTYRMLFSGYANQTGTYSYRIRTLPADQQFTIAIGDTVTNGVPAPGAGNLEAPGVSDVYTFFATAGTSIFFDDFNGERCCINLYAYDPDGGQIVSDRLDGSSPGRRVLAKTGPYKIIVTPAGNDPAWIGTYSFRIRSLAADQQFSINIGSTVTNGVPALGAGNLEQAGVIDTYTFFAAAGTAVNFQDLGAERCCIDWYVFDPDGNTVLSDRLDNNGQGDRVLGKTGTYTVQVQSAGANIGWFGTYSFKVWDAFPIITAQPASISQPVGNTATFSVAARYPSALTYQWRANGTNIPGATNTILALPDIQPAQAAGYSVVVSTTYGSVTSAVAQLTVSSTPPCVAPLAGIIGWWTGNGTTNDLAGTNNGVLFNGAAYGTGRVGQGFLLDGVDDYVQLGTWNPGPRWTIEAWIKPAGTPAGRHTIIGGIAECLDWGVALQDGQFAAILRQPGGCTLSLLSGTTVVTGRWYFVAVTSDGTNGTLYIDGVPRVSALVEPNYIGTSQGTRIGGEACCGSYFPGIVDEVSIYNRALSAAEISLIHLAGASGKCTAPQPPSIFTQPTNLTVLWGESAAFVVGAQSLAQPTYTWLFSNSVVLGAVQPILMLSNIQPAQAGNYYVVVSNQNGSVTSAVATLAVVTNVPDLVARDLVTPGSAIAGQPVSIIWRSANEGTASAASPWRESILFADNPQMSNSVELVGITAGNPLAAGASISRTQTVILPPGRAGSFWLGVKMDSLQQVREGYAESNNLAVAPAPSQLSAPDLVVDSITAASSALFGGSVAVTWVIRNAGSAAANAAWHDQLFFSDDTTLGGDTSLTLSPAPATLASGASYTNSAIVTLPLSHSLAAGSYYILVTADATSAQPESTETNNLRATAVINVTLPPLPDLAVRDVLAYDGSGLILSNAVPTQPVTIVWRTTNSGTAPLTGTWRESILLSADGIIGNDTPLSTIVVTNIIPAGASLSRTQLVSIPITTPVGNLRFVVFADSADEVFELGEQNNAAIGTNSVGLAAQLTLQLPATELLEGGSPVQGSVTRNGDRSQPLSITLSNGNPAELRLPTNIVIAAGQASVGFDVQPLADNTVDGPKTVAITARALGFPAATTTIVVRDADLPHLVLEFGGTSVNEGLTMPATVTRDLVDTNDIVVALACSSPSQLQVPPSVTIPAGQASVTFAVLAVDDSLIESTKTYTVSAGANGYASSSAQLTVNDNDVPAIQLTLAQTNVSEAAGLQATFATVTRAPVSSRALQIELESSNTNAALVPARATIPAGEASVSIPVAAVDNALLDGPKTAELRAFQVDSTTGLRFGAPSLAELTVTDDDGPTLSVHVARKLVAEGLNPATTATVTRNNGTNGSLVVTLSSSDATEATVPSTVTIPSGNSSATFNISTLNDGTVDGNQSVTIRGTASGYTAGEDVVIVSDSDLPDLVISTVEAPPLATTETYATIRYRILNQGLAPAGTNWLTRVFLSRDPLVGDDILVGQYSFTGTIPVSLFFEQTLSILMPQSSGDYWLVVQTDVNNDIHEGLEDNNTAISATPIHVEAAYHAVVQTDVETAPAGTPILMYGQAFRGSSSNPAPEGQQVNVHITVRGTRRILSALTDANGNFALTWTPLASEAGLYQIGAAHPGDAVAPVQDTFTLLGLKASPSAPTVKVDEGATINGSITLQNLSDLPLSGLTATASSKPSNLTISFSVSDAGVVGGLGYITLSYTLHSVDASVPQGTITIHVSTTEGATLDIPLAVTVLPLRPHLVANPTELVRGMKRGVQTVIAFEVYNDGSRGSGPLNLFVPATEWLTLVSTNPAAAIEPGQTNQVVLQLSPAADMPLGEYQGTIAISGTNDTVLVPFKFRALSEAKGDLRISTVDEYTYYAAGSPPLTNASVSVRDGISGLLVTNGVTDALGHLLVPALMEGYYDIEATAPSHVSYRATTLVIPGVTNELTAFLSRETVRYTWTVEPTEIEDRYKVTIESTFETAVPAPVITIEPSVIDLAEITADVTQLEVKISNHGLIAANNTRINFPSSANWQITPLLEEIGTLPAQSSLTIPLTIRRLGGGKAQIVKSQPKAGGDCALSGTVCWELVCGPFKNTYCGTIYCANAGSGCGIVPGPGGGGGGYAIGGGVVYSGGAASVKINCDPKCIVLAGLGCIPGPIGCFFSGFQCGDAVAQSGWTAINVIDCAVGAAGCLIPGAGIPSCIYSLVRCFIGPASKALDPKEGSSHAKAASSETDRLAPYRSEIRSMLDAFNEITGSPDGVWINAASDSATGDWWARFQSAADLSSESGLTLSASEQTALLSGTQPPGVSSAEVQRFLSRWNRSLVNWDRGILSRSQTPVGESSDFIDIYLLRSNVLTTTSFQHITAAAGYSDPFNAVVESLRARDAAGESGGVCARVKIKIEQQAVLTRSAFRATLELENNAATPIESISVQLRITDASGREATELFGTRSIELDGLTAVNGGGVVSPLSTGTARWLLVPTRDAAPNGPVDYYVGGELRYTQDGAVVTIPLSPATITVQPDPVLVLQYFHQRDVFADDPFTPMVEPSIPFSLALMVQNKGRGDAHNLRITSSQPEIVENEKGLLIDFKIIGTEVAGQNFSPSLTADIGDIPAGSTKIARWLLTSTLQGLFIDYSATVEHIDAIEGKKTALIDDVSIHELTHVVQAGGSFEDGKLDFLVNDFPDAPFDLPDTLYQSDGTTNHVEVVTNGVPGGFVSAGTLTVQLTALMPGGWAYLRVADPGQGQFRLRRVVRSDGVVIPVGTNAWTTDRTFIGLGHRPRNENILHLLDYNSTGIYTLEYEPQGIIDTVAPISTMGPLAAASYSRIPLTWSGSDAGGSGIASYDIFVSVNGGPFTAWLQGTRDTSSTYLGSLSNTYAFYSIAIDFAGNREGAPSAPQAQTFVSRSNSPPIIPAIPVAALNEGETLTLDVPATDPDGDTLTYSIVGPAPAGVQLNAASGRLTWSTGESDGPSTNVISVQALDSGIPRLGTIRNVTVVVYDVNHAPTLTAISDRTIAEGYLLQITNSVADTDFPLQGISFSLAPGAPAGAGIDPATGIFSWRPSEFQGGKTNRIGIVARDNGTPSLSVTQSFNVIVRDTLGDFDLSIGTTNVLAGQTGAVPIRVTSGVDLSQIKFLFRSTPAELTNRFFEIVSPQLASAVVEPAGGDSFRVTLTSQPNQPVQGHVDLLQFLLATPSNSLSTVAHLYGSELEGTGTDGAPLRNSRTIDGRIFVIGRAGLLDAVRGTNGSGLVFYARPGSHHRIESTATPGNPLSWQGWGDVPVTNRATQFVIQSNTPALFFRAKEITPAP